MTEVGETSTRPYRAVWRACTVCGAGFWSCRGCKVCSPLCAVEALTDRSAGPDSCHIWGGSLSHGYPAVRRGGALVHLHRLIVERSIGRPLLPGELARHLCGTPRCLNAAHLAPGTRLDNQMDEWVYRGKQVIGGIGIANLNARLDPEAVLAIRRSADTVTALAAHYGVDRQTIRQARNGETWKHVPEVGEVRVSIGPGIVQLRTAAPTVSVALAA